MPSETGMLHAICSFGMNAITGWPSGPTSGCLSGFSFGVPTSTRHMRQLPATVSFGW